jgi:hypothetical protein
MTKQADNKSLQGPPFDLDSVADSSEPFSNNYVLVLYRLKFGDRMILIQDTYISKQTTRPGVVDYLDVLCRR